MEKIKEENKDLIALRNNYFALLIVIGGGTIGLIYTKLIPITIFFILSGTYMVFILIRQINKKSQIIRKNIERLH